MDLPLINWVTLENFLHLSKLQFPKLKDEAATTTKSKKNEKPTKQQRKNIPQRSTLMDYQENYTFII